VRKGGVARGGREGWRDGGCLGGGMEGWSLGVEGWRLWCGGLVAVGWRVVGLRDGELVAGRRRVVARGGEGWSMAVGWGVGGWEVESW
jgi:hypothetical protein